MAASFSIFSIRSADDSSAATDRGRRLLVAAATALSTSAGAASGVSPIGCSVCGEITESRCPAGWRLPAAADEQLGRS